MNREPTPGSNDKHLSDTSSLRPHLHHIDIEVNHRCNLACRHCSARAAKGGDPQELSLGELRDILSRAVPLGLRKVGLTGGEPLFDAPKLEPIARFCIDHLHVPIHMHTNGTLVSDELCAPGAVLSLFEAISITFLGGDALTHDAMTRSKGSFQKAFHGAEICIHANLPLTCYFIPTRGTGSGFKQLMKKLHAIGARRIRAMALAPSGRARDIYEETAATKDELRAFENDLLEVAQRLDMHVEAGYCTRLTMPRLAVLAGHAKCMSAINRVHINSKGDVFPCTAASGVRELRLGNLRKNGFDLRGLWEHSRLVKMIRAVHQGTLAECAACPQDPKCQFGCTVNACGTMPDSTRRLCPLVMKGSHR